MYTENFITPCDACYTATLPACPETTDNITLKAGLGNAQSRVWFIEDKFGNVTSGTATTAANGDLTIPFSDFEAGYFTQYSGQFTLYVKATAASASVLDLTFNATAYECVRINFTQNDSNSWVIQ